VPLARIGEFTRGRARVLAAASGAEMPLDVPGWDHFTDRS